MFNDPTRGLVRLGVGRVYDQCLAARERREKIEFFTGDVDGSGIGQLADLHSLVGDDSPAPCS